MLQNALNVLLYALLPAFAITLGGAWASFRPLRPRWRSYSQHFAAGTVFAAVAIELLPDVMSKHIPIATVLGFALGTALMLTLKVLLEKTETETESESSSNLEASTAITGKATLPAKTNGLAGLATAVGVDITIDGLLVGIGFVAGAREGVLLTIALTLELLSLGLATAATFMQNGMSRSRSVGLIASLAVLPLVGAVLGSTLLSGLPAFGLEAVLAFGVAALLYLVTEELLVEAHEVPETAVTTTMFFVGFLVLLIISMVAG